MSRTALLRLFPRLSERGFAITSPPDEGYNCIAWAAGDSSQWWWPASFDGKLLGGSYWPTDVPLRESLDAFVAAFASVGYSVCESGELEPGYQKIAIYASAQGAPTHAARQLSDGAWVSKLGRDVDIQHNDVEGVCGQAYGRVACFMKRHD